MEFTINRDIFLKSLSHAHGIIEKKNALPILSNILIEAKNSKIKITATDLDLIYSEEISLQSLQKEGSTTTSASILYVFHLIIFHCQMRLLIKRLLKFHRKKF